MGVIGFIHPDPAYALGQWVEFWTKLTHSYTPENLRVSDLFGMLEKAGFPNPLPFNSLSRVVASGTALWFVFWKYRRGGFINGSWGLWVVTALIWTIFNPRAETNSYVLISPILAFAAVSYWSGGGRWKVEGDDPSDRLYWFNVRRDGEADLFGDRRMVETTHCFVGEPVATPNAGKLESC